MRISKSSSMRLFCVTVKTLFKHGYLMICKECLSGITLCI